MPKPKSSKSRVAKNTSKKSSFRFRWWMAVVLVGVITAAGILVLRYSRAATNVSTGLSNQCVAPSGWSSIGCTGFNFATYYSPGKSYKGNNSTVKYAGSELAGAYYMQNGIFTLGSQNPAYKGLTLITDAGDGNKLGSGYTGSKVMGCVRILPGTINRATTMTMAISINSNLQKIENVAMPVGESNNTYCIETNQLPTTLNSPWKIELSTVIADKTLDVTTMSTFINKVPFKL
jgi:hypothetical protein